MITAKKEQRAYSSEFKLAATRLVEAQGYSVKEACERRGLPLSHLR
jgi:transposase-like protein